MTVKIGVVMDPIGSINFKKDSTLAMLWEAQDRQFEIYYLELRDLFLRDGVPYGSAKQLTVSRNPQQYFSFGTHLTLPLADLNMILMRKDPPFNQEYLYATYLLEHAERLGVRVVNRAQSLRDCNEKLFATYFPQCSPPTLVTQTKEKLLEFLSEQGDVVCKPLNSMGGASVFRLQKNDANIHAIFDLMIAHGTFVMAQRFIPQIKEGDKRIIMINGAPIPYVLARVPQDSDWRGNLAVGAKGKVQALSERDQFICAQVGPLLRERGLYFVGLDVIGDYLTEINVTSPTGIREIEAETGINISAQLFDVISSL